MRKRKLKIKRLLMVIVPLCLIIITIFVILIKNKGTKKTEIPTHMKEYGYSISGHETKYYKKNYDELTKILKENVNQEEYARKVAILFLTDFFTLDNKESKSDIGGVMFVYTPYKDDFMKFAQESIYSNINNSSKSSLPEVEEVEITKLSNGKYVYQKNKDDNAYIINASIKYKKDLGYKKKVKLVIIHNQNKLEIAELE